MNLDNAKRWWHSKTIWLGGHLIAASPLLQYARDNVSSLHYIIGKYDAAVSFLLGGVLIWLRNVTTKPIGKPDSIPVTVPAPNPDNSEHA